MDDQLLDSDGRTDRFEAVLRCGIAKLIEECPGSSVAVQVLVSFVNHTGNTVDIFGGAGNWHARTGMCRDFLTRDQARTTNNAIKAENE